MGIQVVDRLLSADSLTRPWLLLVYLSCIMSSVLVIAIIWKASALMPGINKIYQETLIAVFLLQFKDIVSSALTKASDRAARREQARVQDAITTPPQLKE